MGDVMPAWPDAYFGDGFAHLNPGSAISFSDTLGRCLDAEGLTNSCVQRLQTAPLARRRDARYGKFAHTTPDAVRRGRRNSKHGRRTSIFRFGPIHVRGQPRNQFVELKQIAEPDCSMSRRHAARVDTFTR